MELPQRERARKHTHRHNGGHGAAARPPTNISFCSLSKEEQDVHTQTLGTQQRVRWAETQELKHLYLSTQTHKSLNRKHNACTAAHTLLHMQTGPQGHTGPVVSHKGTLEHTQLLQQLFTFSHSDFIRAKFPPGRIQQGFLSPCLGTF